MTRPRKHPWPDGPPEREDEAAWLDTILGYASKADRDRLPRMHAAMIEVLAGDRTRSSFDRLNHGFESQALRRWCLGELQQRLNESRDQARADRRVPPLQKRRRARGRRRLDCAACSMRCLCWMALTDPDGQTCSRCCNCYAPLTPVTIGKVQAENPEADPAGVWWDRQVIGRRREL